MFFERFTSEFASLLFMIFLKLQILEGFFTIALMCLAGLIIVLNGLLIHCKQ